MYKGAIFFKFVWRASLQGTWLSFRLKGAPVQLLTRLSLISSLELPTFSYQGITFSLLQLCPVDISCRLPGVTVTHIFNIGTDANQETNDLLIPLPRMQYLSCVHDVLEGGSYVGET